MFCALRRKPSKFRALFGCALTLIFIGNEMNLRWNGREFISATNIAVSIAATTDTRLIWRSTIFYRERKAAKALRKIWRRLAFPATSAKAIARPNKRECRFWLRKDIWASDSTAFCSAITPNQNPNGKNICLWKSLRSSKNLPPDSDCGKRIKSFLQSEYFIYHQFIFSKYLLQLSYKFINRTFAYKYVNR